MKRLALFSLLLGTSFLFLNLLAGCQSLSANGSQPKFKTVEVKHFTPANDLELSQDFVNYFYDGLREHLPETKFAGQVVDEGSTVPDADAVDSAVLEGKFTEYRKGLVGVVGMEIKLYRRSDHALIATITPRVPYQPSPFNTDKTIGHGAGSRAAYEINRLISADMLSVLPSAPALGTRDTVAPPVGVVVPGSTNGVVVPELPDGAVKEGDYFFFQGTFYREVVSGGVSAYQVVAKP